MTDDDPCTPERCLMAEIPMIARLHTPRTCPERCECEDCEGTGYTIQGWTDKNGYSEDQYGRCYTCNTANAGHFH